jgi:hypothetical protein
MKSRVVAVIEGHELYLRRNGRFDLHWVDPFAASESRSARPRSWRPCWHRNALLAERA